MCACVCVVGCVYKIIDIESISGGSAPYGGCETVDIGDNGFHVGFYNAAVPMYRDLYTQEQLDGYKDAFQSCV